MTLSNVQAAIVAAVDQLAVTAGTFGLLSNHQSAAVISCATAVINAAFLIATALHAQATAQIQIAEKASK